MPRIFGFVLLGSLVGLSVASAQGIVPSPITSVNPGPDRVSSILPASALEGAPEAVGSDFSRAWFNADYLMCWINKGPLSQPLVVTGPETDPFPGVIGQPNTQILYGGQGLNFGLLSGLRLEGGFWFDPQERFGLTGSWFQLETGNRGFNAGSGNGHPYLAEPFIDAQTGASNVNFISQHFANPAQDAALSGYVNISSTSRLWGWETSGLINLARNPGWSLDLLIGYRQLFLNEGLTNTTVVSDLAPGGAASFATNVVPPPASVVTQDSFQTHNRFDGGQIGGRFSSRWERLSLNVGARVGLGTMSELLSISGSTYTNAALPVQVLPGGIYAQQSNIGNTNRKPFAVVPEADLNLGIDLTHWLRARVGYTFLYASSVVRPGAQIDPVINRNQVPIDPAYGQPGGPASPGVLFRESSFWMQGINLGLEVFF